MHTIYVIDYIKAFSWEARFHKIKVLPVSFQMQDLQIMIIIEQS